MYGTLRWHRGATSQHESRGEAVCGGNFGIELENSDRFFAGVTDRYENLPVATRDFWRHRSPPAGTRSVIVQVGYTFGSQRRISAELSVRRGTFYTGEISGVSWRAKLSIP